MRHRVRQLLFLLICTALIWPTSVSSESSGPDRCFIEHCLCQVRPARKSAYKKEFIYQKRSISIYYNEDVYHLSFKQKSLLNNFLKTLPNRSLSISVIGHTDGCGSLDYNYKLSSNRANEIRSFIKNNYPKHYVRVIASGENSYDHRAEAKRVDIIVHSKRALTTAIEKMPSDFYLIDASGSMWSGYKRWSDVIGASLKPNSKIYLSKTSGCYNGQFMSDISPGGGTEIWWSYWNILDKMKPGQSLLIISDFDSTVPLSSREAALMRRKVEEKGIKVNSIKP